MLIQEKTNDENVFINVRAYVACVFDGGDPVYLVRDGRLDGRDDLGVNPIKD